MTDKTTAERDAAQFTACDMATASAQGFRAGRASLPLPGAQDAVALDGQLYAALGDLFSHLGAEGCVGSDHPFVWDAMTALKRIDGGVYLDDLAVPVDLDAHRDDLLKAVQLLEDGEWAEHFAKTPIGMRLEDQITKLHGEVAAPQPALSAGWVSVKDRLPPCRDDQDYIGINSAGFAGIFNAVADIAGNVYCMMETAEESVSIMSDLSIWKSFTRPLPVEPSMDGESK